MKRLFAAGLALLLMGQTPPPARVSDLGWMSGRWETESADSQRITDESWSEPRAGIMLGYSRSGGDRLREFEFLRIQADADGVPTYYAQPNGGPPVGFRLIAHDATSATFENPQHDYPQRIRYELWHNDTMWATISKLDGSSAMRWQYRRQH
jgi:hypothetical protein